MSYKRYHELLQFFILILVLFGLPQSTTALLPEPPLTKPYHFQIHQSAASIGQKNWDSVQTNNLSPFTSFNYLHLLESTGCASPSTGWTPIHVTVSTQSTPSSPPLAIVPCYTKSHSFGEFIFDQPWAEAAHDNNINYYPKILAAIPFTPVSSPKVLIHPNVTSHSEQSNIRNSVADYLTTLATNNNLSSVHVNFLSSSEIKSFPSPYHHRTSLQHHFTNISPTGSKFHNFSHYLTSLKSKRRLSLNRERRKISPQIRIDTLTGKEIQSVPGIHDVIYKLYESTVEKSGKGRLYFTSSFFEKLIASEFCNNVVLIIARSTSSTDENESIKASDIIAGTFNVVSNNIFYGRYWGR
ncbi:hypothetical protein TL16_g04775 [Triparma laevis f. inornata]|uniref:Uncharacterized protein n=1 Tax=Triparma laevis f. inornata TaxID=1714386 RepID=A0A9W7ACE4_9STRA|nr:hypothetical protein TL16_g04775 [Triparma laevis f. inornata]